MSLEQEVKLVVNSTDKIDLTKLTCLVSINSSALETHHLVSTYFDTADQYLSKQKVGLRLRKHDDTWWQTVKTAGVVKDGLHQREEWEFPLKGSEWDLATLRETPLATMIDEPELWSQLSPLFTTDFMRDTLQLTLADDSSVELAYDYGQIIAGDKTGSIHELELELKSGNVEALLLLAKELQAELDVSPSNCSKAQIGYELAAEA